MSIDQGLSASRADWFKDNRRRELDGEVMNRRNKHNLNLRQMIKGAMLHIYMSRKCGRLQSKRKGQQEL